MKARGKESEDSEDEDDEPEEDEEIEDDGMPQDYAEKTIHVHSERLDGVVKAALSMQRSKAEEAYYAGKLYVNGVKAYKKSQELVQGDTVDLVIGPSPDNPEFTVVKRFIVTLMEASLKGKLALRIRKWDSMIVDDYSHKSEKTEDE